MKITLPHKGSQAEGIAQIKKMLAENQDKISQNATDVTTVWQDNVLSYAFTAQGSHITGTLTVLDKEYQLYAALPLALKLFESTIERMIASEVKKLPL